MARVIDFVPPDDTALYVDASGVSYSLEDAFFSISKQPYRMNPGDFFRVVGEKGKSVSPSWNYRRASGFWWKSSDAFKAWLDSHAGSSGDGFESFARAGYSRRFVWECSRGWAALSFPPFSFEHVEFPDERIVFSPGNSSGFVIRRPVDVSFFVSLKESFFSCVVSCPPPAIVDFWFCFSSSFSAAPDPAEWIQFQGPSVVNFLHPGSNVSGKYLWIKINFSRPMDELSIPVAISDLFCRVAGWFF